MTSLGWENWRNFQRAGAMLGYTDVRDFQGLRPTGYWSRAELQEEIAKQCMQERQIRSQ
jgi:hypothetical protein